MSPDDVQDLELLVIGIIFGVMLSILYASIANWWEIRRANKKAAEEQK